MKVTLSPRWPALLLLIGLFTPLAAQKTLFDRALTLDSLYDRIRAGEDELAEDFFAELRGTYPNGPGLTDERIYHDIVGTNEYLRPKLNLVYSRLEDRRGVATDQTARIRSAMDSLYAAVSTLARAGCRRFGSTVLIEDACPYGVSIKLVEQYPGPLQVAALRREVAATDAELAAGIRQLENRLYELDAERDARQIHDESVVQLSANATGGLPAEAEGGYNTSLLSPVVVPAAGAASLQASVIDGASRWIAERMREELSIAFFDRFETWMEDKRMHELFPNTFRAMDASVTTDYALMIQILRSAFRKDLDELPFSFADYLRTELHRGPAVGAARARALDAFVDYARNEAEQYVSDPLTGEFEFNLDALLRRDSLLAAAEVGRRDLVRTGRVLNYVLFTIAAIEELSRGTHPVNVLGELTGRVDEFFPDAGNARPALLLLDVLSRSLIRVDNYRGTTWVDRRELLGLARDAQLREIYFGLVHQATRQRMHDRRAALTEQRAALIANHLTDRPEVRAQELLWSSTTEAIPEVLYDFQLVFPELERQSGHAAAVDQVVAYYNETLERAYDPRVLRRTLDTYTEYLATQPRMADFNYARISELQEEQETAYADFATVLREEFVGQGFSAEHAQQKIDVIRSSLNLYRKAYDRKRERAALPPPPYLPKLMYQVSIQLLGEITEPEPRERILNAARRALAPFVAEYEYADDFLDVIDPIRNRLIEEQHYREVSRDSARFVDRLALDIPEINAVDFELYRLERDQEFLDDILLKQQDRFGQILNEFSQFTERVDALRGDLRAVQSAGSGKVGNPQLINVMRGSLGIVRQLFGIALPGEAGKLDTIQEIADHVLDAYGAVLDEDYDAVVMNVIPIAGTLLDVDLRDRTHQLGSSPSRALLEELAEDQGVRQRKLQEVFRYGAFLAAVVESEDAEDIKDAIRSIALPSGSYSIKRRNFGNISLNAYPGLTGGAELLTGDGRRNWAPNFGFTAPVGLAFSWGYTDRINYERYALSNRYRRRVDRSLPVRGERFLTGHSGSLFFPLLDLGAVVLFRLDGNTQSLPEDVGFQQLFSPGVVYAHGFPNLPVSVLAGVQVSPRLRKFGEERRDAFRFNLGITVDLPMANFHTRSAERER